ncbi:MAG: hypothetical protein AMXMBFR47_39210 [Planctomycetota bacterium]
MQILPYRHVVAKSLLIGLTLLSFAGCPARPITATVDPKLTFRGVAIIKTDGTTVIIYDRANQQDLLIAAGLAEEDIALLDNFDDPCDAQKCVVSGGVCIGTSECKDCAFKSFTNSIGTIAYGCCCQEGTGSR